MSPYSGRFQTMDSFAGGNFDPRTLHKYTYAENDAFNRIDPSGRMSIAETAGVQISWGVLAAMSVLSLATACYLQFALAETANYYGADISSVQSPCVRKQPKPKRILFHYTLPETVPLILGSQQLWPTLNEGGGDATFGFGQYFTDISPIEAGSRTMFELSFALYRYPTRWSDTSTPIGYLAIDVSGLPVRHVAPVYGPMFPGKGIYLHETISALPLRNRIESFGVVPFN